MARCRRAGGSLVAHPASAGAASAQWRCQAAPSRHQELYLGSQIGSKRDAVKAELARAYAAQRRAGPVRSETCVGEAHLPLPARPRRAEAPRQQHEETD
eukprot:1570181-Prymnesium_polylepis.1